MSAVYLLSDPNVPPTAFLLFRPQWVSLLEPTGVPSDAQAGWHRGQNANPYLLHCCTAEPVLTRATKPKNCKKKLKELKELKNSKFLKNDKSNIFYKTCFAKKSKNVSLSFFFFEKKKTSKS